MTVAHFPASGITNAQAAALLHPGYPPAGQQWCMRGTLNSGTAFPNADVLRLVPIFEIVQPITLISLAIRVQIGGAGSSAKLALWRNDTGTARPFGLPVLGSNTPASTATNTTTVAVTGSFFATPGVYWAGVVATGTMPVLLAEANNSTFRGIVQTAAPLNVIATHFSIAQPFANDIMALDLTGAALTADSTAGAAPIFRIEWA